MTFEEANKITRILGRYDEYCFSRLNFIFLPYGGKIPESLLPYPKPMLLEALNIMDKDYFDRGDAHGMMLMRETMAGLVLYGNDEEAIEQVGMAFADAEKRSNVVKNLRDWQKTWLTTQ